MSFQAGDELAHYEILEPIGKGGMGEVYRARDGKLGRDVAIKVLPDDFARDEERLRRFQREAKVLASLNHSNIAAIYGLENTDDTHYLVLELVPGETLAERIARGPLPVEEALDIAGKIADALEQAHEQGIVHRDLKPANVKLTPDDDVKVLDFGLAKALAEEPTEVDSSMSPTITRDATRAGVILGTAAYMSPEQAKGKQVDRRADIWAYGAVLYEMLTGKRAFHGEDVSDTLAAVLRAEPDWDALPASVSTSIRALLRRCLVKNPRERLRDIGDASLFQEAILRFDAASTSSRPSAIPWLVALGAVAVAAAALLFAMGSEDATSPSATHLSIPLPEGIPLAFAPSSNDAMDSSVTISRDGTLVAFSGRVGDTSQLFVRELGGLSVEPLAGTEGATAPVFSLDGTSIIYFRRDPERLMKVALQRGPPITLAEDTFFGGLSWDDDETLLTGLYPDIGIWRFSTASGELERLTEREGDMWQYWPHPLPDRDAVLFTSKKGTSSTDIEVLDMRSGKRHVIVHNASSPQYTRMGHLVFQRDGSLFAAPFDDDALEVAGEAVLVVPGVAVHRFGGAHYSFSDSGTLLYVPSPLLVEEGGAVMLVDRNGDEQRLPDVRSPLAGPRWAPNGRYLAISRDRDVWLFDVQRELTSRFTVRDGSDQSPLWSPDGTRLLFASNRAGPFSLYQKPVDTDEPPSPLAPSEYWQFPSDWSPDGSQIVFMENNPSTGDDLWLYSIEEAKARPLLVTEFNESSASFSPDGRWIVYVSEDSGRSEVFVRSVDASGGRPVQVSREGGLEPRWSRAGNELFYRNQDRMMVATIATSPTVSVGTPEVLFEGRYRYQDGVDKSAFYDVSPDGQRFVMVRPPHVTAITEIRVVLNWFDELKRLVPTD